MTHEQEATVARPTPLPTGPGQESVWDYPRPPRVEPCAKKVRVAHAGETVAESDRALRVLETAGPPTIYLPPEDVRTDLLVSVLDHSTYCEWKGEASYFDVVVGDALAPKAAWTYRDPKAAYRELKDFISFYPGRVECHLGGERVRPQPGAFYGGWITDDIVGPFKGEPGSRGW